ncbi:MmcQ/YjbR family DNA-binding protein [Poseidonocella sp. HB161398]|uniref:MmcQ/YjbR family DNA-binding protein n=1 Tax=Poseidonocella sp. HB161398 TaxID=2320855 RepID=UPI0011082BDB|nr:MmcQ/YjbR family DNA-binding protein [Poseidonocella sp. HB161398]
MEAPLERLRAVCLGFPEAEDQPMRGGTAYRVRGRIFAMPRMEDGAPAVWLKAPRGAQALLVEAAPATFFRPPYVGPKGWIGLRLHAGTDWDEAEAHIRRSYALVAPKALARLAGAG